MLARREYLGRFNNDWRRRTVAIYATDNPARLITVGRPYDGGSEIVCEEQRRDYVSTLFAIQEAADNATVYVYR